MEIAVGNSGKKQLVVVQYKIPDLVGPAKFIENFTYVVIDIEILVIVSPWFSRKVELIVVDDQVLNDVGFGIILADIADLDQFFYGYIISIRIIPKKFVITVTVICSKKQLAIVDR